MKGKKILIAVLCLAMIISVMAGCASKNTDASQPTAAASESSAAEQTTEAAKQFEHADITMVIVSSVPNEEAYSRIAEEMSKITEEKFNVTMHIMNVTLSDYTTKMNMALAAGDTIDLFQGFSQYDQYVSMGYMLDLTPYTDLLQDAIETVGDTVRQGYTNGQLFSLPIINLGGTGGDAYGFRKDIIDELGIDLTQYKTLPELEEVLVKIKEAYPSMTPMMSGSYNSTIMSQGDPINGRYFDNLNNSFVHIDPSDPDAKVTVIMKEEYWKEMAELAWDWAQKGLVGYDEIAIDFDNVKAGRAAVAFTGDGPNALAEIENNSGCEMVLWEPQIENKPYITTMNVWSWSITEYTKYPEQAALVLNELYINPDLSNLLVWGIEGEDYQFADEEKSLVTFLDGEDQSTVRYFNYIKDNVPNLYICYESASNPDLYEGYQEWKSERMWISPYLGFTPDADAYVNEAAACQNVLDQYRRALLSGQLDPSVAYDEMIAKLDAAGIETIREQVQLQLDAWIAENNK